MVALSVATAASTVTDGSSASRSESTPTIRVRSLHVAAVALGEHHGQVGFGGGAGDEGVDDVAAVLEDRADDLGLTATIWPGRSSRQLAPTIAAMPASTSIRSFRRATSACFDPMLSYTVCADTPAASAMSRTLVRL